MLSQDFSALVLSVLAYHCANKHRIMIDMTNLFLPQFDECGFEEQVLVVPEAWIVRLST